MVVNTPDLKGKNVLVVEDEVEISELISMLLTRQGYSVDKCASANEAQSKLSQKKIDLIILDWMLPSMSGIDFLGILKSQGNNHPPVLMVTAKSAPADVVRGLEAGADDYVTKPFEPAVFVARANALLRRYHLSAHAGISEKAESHSLAGLNQGQRNEVEIGFGELKLNLESYRVTLAGGELHLTPSEFKIASEMARNKGKVLTREHLIHVVQGDGKFSVSI